MNSCGCLVKSSEETYTLRVEMLVLIINVEVEMDAKIKILNYLMDWLCASQREYTILCSNLLISEVHYPDKCNDCLL